MSGHGEKLTRSQEKAIIALLAEPTIGKAAESVGIGEATLRRWLKRDDFQASYREARREAVSQAIARLQKVCPMAVIALAEIAADKGKAPASRVTAAKAILDLSIKGVELEDLETQMAELKAEVEQLKHVAQHYEADTRNGHRPGLRHGH